MKIFGVELLELREPAEQNERARRVAELDEDLLALRRKLARAYREEICLRRRRSEGGRFEAAWLQAERERLESAVANLTKERAELLDEI
jgi:hypothetical protein